MNKYLSFWILYVFCFCFFVSCSNDRLDLEEKKSMLIGEWYITEDSEKIPESSDYLAHLKFNQDGTGSGYFFVEMFQLKVHIPDFTYKLIDLDGDLYLFLKYTTGTEDSLYLLELTNEYMKWNLKKYNADNKPAVFKKE